jgi:accessory gene regulator B
MIDTLAMRIATGIKNTNPEKTASIEVMQYALIGLINTSITVVLAFSFGLLTGKFSETVLFSLAFIILRSMTGGFHFGSSVKCTVVSTIMAAGFPHIPISVEMMFVFQILSLGLILLFAPSNIEGQTRIPTKYYPHLKIFSLLLVISNFFIGSPVIAFGFLVQSLTLIRFNKKEVKNL